MADLGHFQTGVVLKQGAFERETKEEEAATIR